MKKIITTCIFLGLTLLCHSEEMVLKQLTPTQRLIVREDKTVWQVLVQLDTHTHEWVDESSTVTL